MLNKKFNDLKCSEVGLTGQRTGKTQILKTCWTETLKLNISILRYKLANSEIPLSQRAESQPRREADLEKCAEDVRCGSGCEDEGEEGAEASIKNGRADISHGLDSSQV